MLIIVQLMCHWLEGEQPNINVRVFCEDEKKIKGFSKNIALNWDYNKFKHLYIVGVVRVCHRIMCWKIMANVLKPRAQFNSWTDMLLICSKFIYYCLHWGVPCDIGGSRGRARRTPPRVQVLSFRHTKFLKRNRLGSRRLPYGKSWIRHCIMSYHPLDNPEW